MAEDVARLHTDAVLARLRAHTQLATIIFDGQVGGSPERYAVVWPNNGARSPERLDRRQVQVTSTFTIHSVGHSREQAQWVAEKVIAQLVDFRPDIAGRSCWRITQEVSRPVAMDRDVTPPLYFTVDQFDLTSTPKRVSP